MLPGHPPRLPGSTNSQGVRSNVKHKFTKNVKSVKFEYNRTRPNEVYNAIKMFYPDLAAKDFTAAIIEKFIPEDACPIEWNKNLRNIEYSRSQPKKAKRSRSKTGCYNRKHNPTEAITKATTFNALMEAA